MNYGTNESGFPISEDRWGREMRKAVGRLRAALPDTSILLMSTWSGREIGERPNQTIPSMPRLVLTESERWPPIQTLRIFNTFEAMGGPGTMGQSC